MDTIKRVLLVGGTHGNELIGVHLIKMLIQFPKLAYRSSFETLTLLGNPKAIDVGTRYIDKDLNRCFNFQDIVQEHHGNDSYERQRALEICDEFGTKGRIPVDLIIDQHSTTSNAGIMLILDRLDAFTVGLVNFLSSINSEIKIYSSAKSGRKQDSLRSIAKRMICIEVGPIAHGTLQAELFQKTKTLVYEILNYVEQYNNGLILPEKQSLTFYQYIGVIDYPRNQVGELQAMIHPRRQFKDYEVMHPGDPIFLTFNGEIIRYQGCSDVYPIFINEAAYYEKGIAMLLTEKKTVEVG